VSHPLVAAVARILPGGGRRAAFLELLERRLAALGEVSAGRGAWPRSTRCDRALALRVLRPHEAAWDDGDENLVRGYLDRWRKPGEDPLAGAAASLLAAADEIGRLDARPGTLLFLLWEMDSMLTSREDIARIRPHTGKNRPHPGGR
jgi:hypothetical protein